MPFNMVWKYKILIQLSYSNLGHYLFSEILHDFTSQNTLLFMYMNYEMQT
jgi:hypothetical protein